MKNTCERLDGALPYFSPSTITMLAAKFRGCMIGSLIGDCLGAPFEGDFPVSKTILGRYISGIRDSGKSGVAQKQPYTDDTAMTFSVAKSLTERKRLDPKDMAKKFVVEYYANPKRGYGMNVVDVFEKLRRTECDNVFLPAKQQFEGSGSYGNGAAMRIAPIALYGHNKSDQFIKEAVQDCSLITHTHQNGYNGALLQCFAIQEALKLDPSTEIEPIKFISSLQDKFETVEKEMTVSSLESKRPYCDALQKINKIFEENQTDLSEEEIAAYLGNDVSAHKSVPTAIYSFLRGFKPLPNFKSDNVFERTLYFAISVGGDTDTIASMANSISGAYLGEGEIPNCYKIRSEAIDESVELADLLFELNEKE